MRSGAALAFVLATGVLAAQGPTRTTWSIEEPHGPSLPFETTLDEGTWISLDVAPDGRSIAFDLLGDLYVVPAAGGTATRITSGRAYDTQPRFSPDGSRLVFVSDRGGTDNIWIAAADGSQARALTDERDSLFISPVFSPDGAYVIAKRWEVVGPATHQPAQEIWAFHVQGGRGFKITTRERFPRVSGPAPSPDGRFIYFSAARAAGPDTFREGTWQIFRYDRASGDVLPLTGGYGGAVRPAVSPDGRHLAYGRRIDAAESLIVRTLATGAERVLYSPIDRDEQESVASTDLLPGYSFTPDGKAIVLAALGKIRRIDLATGDAAVIPFSARVEQQLTERVSSPRRIDDGPVSPRLLRWLHATPDKTRLIFGAAGRNYRYDLAAQTATPIADGPGLEYAPAVSPDGRWVAFVRWVDEEGGQLMKAPIDAAGADAALQLTNVAGHYEQPSWSADGSKIAFVQRFGGATGGRNSDQASHYDVKWIDATATAPPRTVVSVLPRGIRRQTVRPTFDPSGSRIYYTEGPEPQGGRATRTDLMSAALDGSDRRRLLRFVYADDLMVSPDGQWVAYTEQSEVFLVPLPLFGGDPIDVGPEPGRLPVARLSSEGGAFVSWMDDGKTIAWSWGPALYQLPLASVANGRVTSPPKKTDVTFPLPRLMSTGAIVLRNARIVTMGPDGVIERGDLVVQDGRILAVGRSGRVPLPGGAQTIDVAGKTIVPGIIDVHAHYYYEATELLPERNWELIAHLAYGVTTFRDPSVRSQAIFTLAEMVETGATIGPRIFSTGDILRGGEAPFSRPVRSFDDARAQVRRAKALGATSIKQYLYRRRDQRQWIVEAAREEGLVVTPEGGNQTRMDLTTVMDGHTALEHQMPTAPLYRDIIGLLARSGTYYTPTLLVGYGGPTAETWFYQTTDVHADAKLRRFTPHSEVDVWSRRRTLIPEDEYHFKAAGRSAADLLRAGGHITVGGHGNQPGLGTHWEMWALAMSGLTPMEVLRSATLTGAEALGVERDLGSLEVGKLGDLLVLDGNPLDDIRRTAAIRYVMKAGRVWRGETMDEVWPQPAPLKPFYWQTR